MLSAQQTQNIPIRIEAEIRAIEDSCIIAKYEHSALDEEILLVHAGNLREAIKGLVWQTENVNTNE